MTVELEELKEAFHHCLSITKEKLDSDRVFPKTHEEKLFQYFKEIAQEELFGSIFLKKNRYVLSILNSISKTNRNCLVVGRNKSVGKIEDLL